LRLLLAVRARDLDRRISVRAVSTIRRTSKESAVAMTSIPARAMCA
jgi:hypothetical protein